MLGTAQASLACTASGACRGSWSLYVDGAPVPGTSQLQVLGASGSISERLTLAGIKPNVPAGTHTLTIKEDHSGNVGAWGMNDRSLTGIALGSS